MEADLEAKGSLEINLKFMAKYLGFNWLIKLSIIILFIKIKAKKRDEAFRETKYRGRQTFPLTNIIDSSSN